MKLEVNVKLVSTEGVKRIEKVTKVKACIYNYGNWIMAVSFCGHRVAAFPISTINRLAPPTIAIEDNGTYIGHGIDNRKSKPQIFKKLKCENIDDEDLKKAIHLLKKAINSVSK